MRNGLGPNYSSNSVHITNRDTSYLSYVHFKDTFLFCHMSNVPIFFYACSFYVLNHNIMFLQVIIINHENFDTEEYQFNKDKEIMIKINEKF